MTQPEKVPVDAYTPQATSFEPLSKYWITFGQVGGLDALKRQTRMKVLLDNG